MSGAGRSGRRPGEPDTRGEVLAAARRVFATHGYEGASIRTIAAEAGVDPALIHHYFGTKRGLFREAATFPLDVDQLLAAAHGDQPADRAAALARFFFTMWENEPTRLPLLSVLRSAMTDNEAAALLRSSIVAGLLGPIARTLDLDQPQLRLELCAAQLVGIAMLRYVIQIEPLATMPVEQLLDRVTPVLEHHLFTT